MVRPVLVIGNKNYSSWSLRPWIFMRYFNLPFDEKRVAMYVETTRQQLAPYYSNYKVPVLQEGERIVWDSLAILEYVSEQYLGNKGWPNDATARAVARGVSAEMHSSFTHLRSALPMNCRKHFPGFAITTQVQADIDRIAELWRYCRKKYGQGGPWLFGQYSIADAMYAPVVLRFMGYDVALGAIESDYIKSVMQLPALQEWIEAAKLETEVIGEAEI